MAQAMTADHVFLSACTSSSGATGIHPATLPDNGLTFTHDATVDSWSIAGDGLALVFGPAERDATAPASVLAYAKTGTSGSDRLRIGVVGANGIALDYVRRVTVNSVNAYPLANYTCVIGVPTLVSDAPAGTNFSFQPGLLTAIGYRTPSNVSTVTGSYDLSKSTVTLDVDLANGTVRTVIHLIGAPLPSGSGADVDFGTITGDADIDPATGAYYGTTWTSPDAQPFFAQFGGRFYGPQGREAAYALTFLAHRPDGTDLLLSGTVFARR